MGFQNNRHHSYDGKMSHVSRLITTTYVCTYIFYLMIDLGKFWKRKLTLGLGWFKCVHTVVQHNCLKPNIVRKNTNNNNNKC
jgi:hypothetical protein